MVRKWKVCFHSQKKKPLNKNFKRCNSDRAKNTFLRELDLKKLDDKTRKNSFPDIKSKAPLISFISNKLGNVQSSSLSSSISSTPHFSLFTNSNQLIKSKQIDKEENNQNINFGLNESVDHLNSITCESPSIYKHECLTPGFARKHDQNSKNYFIYHITKENLSNVNSNVDMFHSVPNLDSIYETNNSDIERRKQKPITLHSIVDHNKILTHQNSSSSTYGSLNSIITNNTINQGLTLGRKLNQRFKLIIEGDLQICKLQRRRSVLGKLLNSKLLRRWKSQHIVLTDTEISSNTKTDNIESSVPYHTILDITPISKWESDQKYCMRIMTTEGQFLIQTSNIYVRDQWINSIIWKKHKFKSERILRNANRPEVLIEEINNMINMSLSIPIEDTEIYQYPLELISDILQKHELPKHVHEQVIVCLGPLLEKNHPSPEICDFFSKHCRDSPRSHIVIEMFSPVVRRILKHNGDFGRYPRMRLFIQDYLIALMSQNAGLQTIQNFVIQMHSTSSQCPFPRVLPNFVSVCLASIHGCFEINHRVKKSQQQIEPKLLSESEQENQLICHSSMMLTMSTQEDWRIHLSQLIQSVPFPDAALSNRKFMMIFKNVIKNFAIDQRCEIHQTLLGIREGKEGWLEIFCPGGISCEDNGKLFIIMLEKLIGCCCKKKRFLLSINKLLPKILELANQEVPCAIETLCAMLDLDGLECTDNIQIVVKTLQNTMLGLKMYAKVCERQIQLKELQQKGGPRKLTLPSRSTDEDLAKILLSGSFGNLECLSLAFTNVTSSCAEYLIKLPSLRYLNLWSTKFGDKGLELISEHLQKLQVLNLCETPVTDKGLSCLASMKQLRKLNLNSTNLSALTFEGLKECLPALQECDIRYTDAW